MSIMRIVTAVALSVFVVSARAGSVRGADDAGVTARPAGEPEALAVSARYVGKQRFRIRLTNRGRTAIRLLLAYGGEWETAFFFSFDTNETMPITAAPRGPAIRWLRPGRSLELVTEPKPLCGEVFEPRVVYDTMRLTGTNCGAPGAGPCYLTTERCPDCALTTAVSPVITKIPECFR